MKLYKYTRFDIGKKIISSSQMALSKPEAFNDPFDCIPVFDENEQKRAVEILHGYVMDKKIAEYLQAFKKNENSKKDRAFATFILVSYEIIRWLIKLKPSIYEPYCTFKIIKRILRFSNLYAKKTSDIKALIEFVNYVESIFEKQGLEMIHDLFNMRNRMYVACFSATYESILMWSYYGEDHKGICFEIEIDDNSEYLSKVQYQNERPTMQTEKLLRNFCGQLFANKGQQNANALLLPLILQPYITKAEEWRHEQEYRMIYLQEAFEKEGIIKKICDDGRERFMCPIKITKVFCGANMSEDNKDMLRKIIPTEIEIVEMKISDTKYELLTQ